MLAKDQDWLYQLTDKDRSFYRMLLPREHALLDALAESKVTATKFGRFG